MRRWHKVAIVVIVSLAGGIGSAALAIRSVGMNAGVRNGCWGTNLAAGSQEADMYTRAAIAIGGLFALDKRETLYFNTFEDDQGAPLRAQCDYVLAGRDLDARWWSFTVYGEDHFLIPNEAKRYSYNLLNLERKADRSYEIHLSSTAHEGNWLPTGTGRFSVTLRLYNPGSSVYQHPSTTDLPRIT
ncbi:MAG: DUF1214 domain-containing protein, partial [Deltaproteobacteria bacterium]|nr:DUF1214 domain-containing protein [Deltaproteobacteria bacterium]